jgi:hypothetical protein
MILTSAYCGLDHDIFRFLRNIGGSSALIRHDTRDEKPPYPRGGFVVPESLLRDVLSFFFRQNRIIAVYEPLDPLLNSYNLNFLFESATDVLVEVVGPGFDASDLQRGDLSPHETFSIVVPADGGVAQIRQKFLITESEYQVSKEVRREKVRRRLEDLPTPALARAIHIGLGPPESLEEHLRSTSSPLVESGSYIPISKTLIRRTMEAILSSDIVNLFRKETGVGFPVNLSTSLVNLGKRQIYWDIVSPALKFQGLKHSRS